MKLGALFVVVVLLLAACVPIPAAPTVATEPQPVPPTATAIAPPPTPEPPTPEPTAPPPADTATTCDRDTVVATVRGLIPYDEFTVGYSNYVDLGIEPTLDIWYVDSDLDPAATGDQTAENAVLALPNAATWKRAAGRAPGSPDAAALAFFNAATLAQQLARSDAGPCIEELFTLGINTVAVDREYNGWYAGLMDPVAVAAVDDLATADEATIAGFAETQYLRVNPTEPVASPPDGACTWPEARDGIAEHFAAEEPNTYTYLVRDEDGATVYAFWRVPEGLDEVTALAANLAAAGNVLLELGCLHPLADQFIGVGLDATGNLVFLGRMQGDALRTGDISQLEILYPENAAFEPSPITGEGALHLGWVWPEEGPLLWPALAVGRDGVVYVADQEDGSLHAVAAPGEALWSVESECGLAFPPALGAAGDALYLVGYVEEDDSNNVCAVTLDGDLLWATPVEGLLQYIPNVAPDGSLYLRTEEGVVRITPDGEATEHALPEEATGSTIRATSDAPLVVDGAGNSYFVNTLNSQVVVVSPEFETRAECPVGRGPAGVIGALRGDDDESSDEGAATTMINVWVSEPVARADAGFVVAADPGVIAAYDPDCNELWRYTVFESEEPADRLVVAAGPDGAIYAGGAGGLLLALTADGELSWRNEAVEGAPPTAYLDIGDDGAIAALADYRPTLLAYTAEGAPTLAQVLYELDNTSLPAPMPGGDVAQIHQGQLKIYTSDPALLIETKVAPPPADRAAAEAEIAAYMLDLIAEEDIEATLQYIEDSGWQEGDGPTEHLIVWTALAPEGAGEEDALVQAGVPKLDEENPIKLWAYDADGLAELAGSTEQMAAEIEAYHANYMNMDEGPDIFAWGFYQFAITELDESLQKAEVYRAASCGRLCGSGYLLRLERMPDGEWALTGAEQLW